MSTREAIGVDLGGTKMLVGVVDAEQKIHYEGMESSIGLSEDRLVEDLAAELQEAKTARPNVRAAGLGIPATIDRQREKSTEETQTLSTRGGLVGRRNRGRKAANGDSGRAPRHPRAERACRPPEGTPTRMLRRGNGGGV